MIQYKNTLNHKDNRHSCAKLKTYHFSGVENIKIAIVVIAVDLVILFQSTMLIILCCENRKYTEKVEEETAIAQELDFTPVKMLDGEIPEALLYSDGTPCDYDEDDLRLAYHVLSSLGIHDGMKQSEAVSLIMDWMLDNIEYDTDLELSDWSDALNYHKTVCNGYAQLFQLFCQMIGVECYKVDGYDAGAWHAWNFYKVGGCWYWCDLTSADLGMTDSLYQSQLWDDYVPVNFYIRRHEYSNGR